jgi:CheY-like chemotaxis protein
MSSRILLADDSPQALRLGEQILRGQGIEVVSVTDGAVALRRLADVNPDLLIVDVFLPTKNAFDVVRFLRSQPQYSHIPVVFAAGPADRFDEQDAKNAGADVILKKPFEASLLVAAIQPLLDRSKAARGGAPASAANPGLDRSTIRAAVTLALDAAMPSMIEELTDRVLLALAPRG